MCKLHKLFFLAAVAMAVLSASCSKETKGVPAFRATSEQAAEQNGKVSLSGLSLRWSAGDEISVYDNAANAGVYRLSSGAGTGGGEFAYSSGSSVSEAPYSAVYPASIRTGAATVSLPAVQHSANGGLQELPMYAVGDDMDLKFYHLCGVVRFSLSASSAVSVSRIAVATDRAVNGSATVSGSGSSVSLSTPSGSNVATLACQTAQNIASAKDFYIYLPAGTYSSFHVLVTATDGSVCAKSANCAVTIERGKITTITLSSLDFAAHRFSTSSSASVVFSPGNLQYIGSAATPYWKFADHQWDCFGRNEQYGSAANKADIDRDLFGWGTSGWDGSGASYFEPWHTTNTSSAYGPVGEASLVGAYAQADWGVHNAIVGGGNAAALWRTLTHSEWAYMLNTRSANPRFAKAELGGSVSGLVVFPDDYSHPAEVAPLNSTNNTSASYSSNQLSFSDWGKMEAAGAVFLPVTGSRSGTLVYYLESGYYWLSTHSSSTNAQVIYFASTSMYTNYSTARSLGCAVRLVRD